LRQVRKAHQPLQVFAEGRPEQKARLERIAMRPTEDEHCVHFAGADPVGESGRHEGARTHAD
jgi:hypothetical protein